MDNAPPFALDPLFPRPFEQTPAEDGAPKPGDGSGRRRIKRVRLAEIAYRGWQQAAKWLDGITPAARAIDADALLREQAPDLSDPATAERLLRDFAAARFFAGATLREADLLRGRLDEHVRDLVSEADTLLEHRFALLGYSTLWAGDPIDWHLDPVRDRRSPLVPWTRLDPYDAALVGDSRIVWELNRHQWIVRVAQAYSVTGDERYSQACTAAIESWLDANPTGLGLNWTRSLEVAFRLISWCWVVILLRESQELRGRALTRILASIWEHATHVRRYLSYYFAPDTHLTGEALGLFYAGTLFPEFRDAAKWRGVGADILISQSDAQIHDDGVHFEQSTCYQRYTVETYLHFLLLARRNTIAVPESVSHRLEQMLDFLLAVRQPDGALPSIGDADGGWLMPFTRRSPDDMRGVFAAAGAMLQRADYVWAAQGGAPEVFWLLGPAGAASFEAMRPSQPSRSASCVFPSGGYAVMRTGWEPDAHQAIVDIGPLGCPLSSGHGHADLLSLQCTIFGDPCVVDAGTYTYAADSAWRDYFRGTAAHSTVMIDGQGQAETAGSFGWRRRPRVRLREWHSNPQFDFLDAEHDAYVALPDPVIHRRRVIFVKPGYWILVDDLTGAARHQVDLMFQFEPLDVTLGPHPWARAETANGHVLWISPYPAGPIQTAVKRGELSPPRGWISPHYGQRSPAPMLIYSCAVALPWRIVTLLLPDRQGLAAPPAVRPIYDAAGVPTGFTFERPRRSVRFDDHAVLVERE